MTISINKKTEIMNATAIKTVTTKKGLTFTSGESYRCLLMQDGTINVYCNDFEFVKVSKSVFNKIFK